MKCKNLVMIMVASFLSLSIMLFAEDKKTEYTHKDEKTGEVTKVKVEEKGTKVESSTEKTTSDGKKETETIQTDSEKGTTTYTKKDESGKVVESASVSDKIPDNFRKDLPIYKGSKVVVSTINDSDQSIILKSEDSIDKINEYYKGALPKNGWKIVDTQDMTMGESKMTNFQCEKEKTELTVHIMTVKEGEKTVSQITMNAGKNE